MASATGSPETLSVNAAARLMNVTTYTALALAVAGKVQVGTGPGGRVTITRESAERFAAVLAAAPDPLNRRGKPKRTRAEAAAAAEA